MKKYLIPVIILFISSCASNEVGHSKDVSQDEINQGFYITYNEMLDETEVRCVFRFAGPNGTTLILDEPSKIELNGVAMEARTTNARGSFYFWSGKPASNKFNFKFTDVNGKKYENNTTFRELKIEELPAKINRNEPLVIRFNGETDERGDNVMMMIQDDSTSAIENAVMVLPDRVTFQKEKLQKLHGHAKMELMRSGSSSLKHQTHAGGFIANDFVFNQREFDLVD